MIGVIDKVDLDEVLARALVRPLIKNGKCIYDVSDPKILKIYLARLQDNQVIGEWKYGAGGKTVCRIHPLDEAKILYENKKEFSHPGFFHYHTKNDISDRIKELN